MSRLREHRTGVRHNRQEHSQGNKRHSCVLVHPCPHVHRHGQGGAVIVHQDARLFVATLDPGERIAHESGPGRHLWLQIARGIVSLNDTEMREGDGAAIENERTVTVEADTDAEILLFDLG